MKNQYRRVAALALVFCIVFSGMGTMEGAADAANGGQGDIPPAAGSYREYQDRYAAQPEPGQTVRAALLEYRASDDHAVVKDAPDGREGVCVETGESGYIEWDLEVPETGRYAIELDYYTETGRGSAIVRKILIDGELPFSEAANLRLYRVYRNQGAIVTLDNGNQVRPVQEEENRWITTLLRDSRDYEGEPFRFFFTTGRHTVRLEAIRENLVIGAIRLRPAGTVSAYRQPQGTGGAASSVPPWRIQGEEARYKSDATLYPVNDNSAWNTEPSSPSKILLNTIGGDKWKTVGQWLEWEFTVPKTGYYKLAVKARQNLTAGQPSYRRIWIDGEVPFEEFQAVQFPYSSKWELVEPRNGEEPCLLYLEAGQAHTLRMEATLGGLRELIREVDGAVSRLSAIYRDILFVVGHDVDIYRDYPFEQAIPDTLSQLRQESERLAAYYDEYVRITGAPGSQAQVLANMARQAADMAERPYRIPRLMADFSNNISALGSWLSTAQTQPLEIDYIEWAGADQDFTPIPTGFFRGLVFSFQQFLASFTSDYTTTSTADGDMGEEGSGVTAWLATGRDQANVLSQLAEHYFTGTTGIPVRLQLVPAGTLLTATLAGKGPDVSLSMAQSDPINYAIRGAVEDLSGMEGFDTVAGWFQPSALLPLSFQGKTYALPETQSFPVLFYREDILAQLSLEVPETWEDVAAMLPVLQKKNLSFGLPADLTTYATLLFQNGGRLYNADFTASDLNSMAGAEAFENWTVFYTDYSLALQYDFQTRFRSGEIPIAIANYGMYNALSVFAPELDGLWSFAEVPGTRRGDGTVDHTTAGTVTGAVMMSSARNKSDAWEFLRWWASAQTQTMYGRELESVLGTAGRYQAANVEALYNIPWDSADFQVLLQQLRQVRGIEEIPGSYMTQRYIDFAFRQVTVSGDRDVGRALVKAVRQIDSEIAAKRREFGLD